MTREEAIRTLEEESCYECTWGCESPTKCNCPECNLKSAVKVAIEALKDRPHGEWIQSDKDKYWAMCSVCKKEAIGGDFMILTDFCPNCGASMISSNSEIEKVKK